MISEILAGGVRLAREQPKAIAIWGVAYLVVITLAAAWTWPMMPAMVEFQMAAEAVQAAQQPPPPPPPGFFGAIIGINLITLLAMSAIFAAAVRAVARGGDDTFGFLRIGMDELRLIGLGLLLFLIGMAGLLAFVLVASIIVAVLAVVLGNGALVVAIPLYLLLIGLIIWVQVRLSLTGALTVLRGQIVIREAWRMTAGRFWPLFGVYLLLGLAFVAISLVLTFVLNPDLLVVSFGQADPAEAQAMIARMQEAMFETRMIATMLVGTVINAFLLAVTFGAVATAALRFDRADH